jgi:hypothetical protein
MPKEAIIKATRSRTLRAKELIIKEIQAKPNILIKEDV